LNIFYSSLSDSANNKNATQKHTVEKESP